MAADGSIVIETRIDDKKAQQDLDALQQKIASLEQEQARLAGEREQATRMITQSTEKLRAEQEKLVELQERAVAASGEQAENLRIQAREQEKRVFDASGELQSARLAEQNLKDEADGVNDALNDAKNRAGELVARLLNAAQAGQQAGESIEIAMTQSLDARNVIIDTREAQKELEKLGKKIESLNQKIAQTRNVRMPFAEQAQELSLQLEIAQRKLAEMQESGRWNVSESELRDQREMVKSLESRWNEVQRQVEKYDRQIDKASQDLAEARERVEQLSTGLVETELPTDYEEIQQRIRALQAAQTVGEQEINRAVQERDSLYQRLLIEQDRLAESQQNAEAAQSTANDPYAQRAEQIRIELEAATRQLETFQSEWESGSQSVTEEQIRNARQLVDELRLSYAEARQEAAQQSPAIQAATRDAQAQAVVVDNIRQQYERASAAVDAIAERNARLTNSIEQANAAASELSDSMGEAGDAGSIAGNETAAAMNRASNAVSALEKRIVGLAKRALFFYFISKLFRDLREYITAYITSNDEATAAIARLKAAFQTLAQPILQIVLPAFITFVNVLTVIVTAVARVISALTGKTLEQSAASAKAFHEQQKEMKAAGKAAKKAGEEAKKSLAAFDEIYQIGQKDSSATDAGGSGAGAGGGIEPDFSDLLSGRISDIAGLLMTGIAMLVIGAILAFTGVNVPLGITLMAAGAAVLWSAVSEDWQAVKKELEGPLGDLFLLIGSALLVIGAILAFSGANLPLGIALMAEGALVLGTVITARWGEEIAGELRGTIGIITAIVSVAFLAIGAILAFSGVNIPLGISLIAIGAIGLVAIAAARWDEIVDLIRGPIGVITALISASLLVIGAILTFSGVNIPLGLALMAIGAIGLTSVIAVNWNKIVDAVGGPVSTILLILGTALLAVGAVLTFTGANIPLGLGLMVAGATSLAAAAKFSKDGRLQKLIEDNIGNIELAIGGFLLALGFITAFFGNVFLGIGLIVAGVALMGYAAATKSDELSKTIIEVVADLSFVIGEASLVLGAILAFSGANVPVGIALLLSGAMEIATALSLNWNIMRQQLNGPVGEVFNLVSVSFLVLGAILAFSGASIPLGIGLLLAGAVGLATSVAARWDTIRQTLQSSFGRIQALFTGVALVVIGLILAMSGVGVPLGIGMIAAGGVSLAASAALNWDYILIKLRTAWLKIEKWFQDNVAPKLTKAYWEEKLSVLADGAKGALNKVISVFESAVNSIIQKINTLNFDVPDWVPGIGGGKIGFNLPTIKIPRLAQGAVIPPNREFLALLGDQRSGTNIETPLDTMIEAFRQVLQDYNGEGTATVIVNLDGEQIARYTERVERQNARRYGR